MSRYRVSLDGSSALSGGPDKAGQVGMALVMATLLVLLVGTGPVAADHFYVRGLVEVYRGPTQVAQHGAEVVCGGPVCIVQVPTGRRDYGRVMRWCRTDGIVFHLAATETNRLLECEGPSIWSLQVRAFLLDGNHIPVPHGEAIEVRVLPIP